jgi:adenosylhomocysteine nucleosidase
MPADNRALIGVITALPDELGPIRRRVRNMQIEGRSGLRVWTGILGGRTAAFACTGSGNRNAAARSLDFLERVGPSVLIGAGVAGALAGGLSAGDIVVGESMIGPSGETFRPDPDWLGRALSGGAAAASFRTVDRIVCTPDQRGELLRLLPEGRPAAVDLETSFWAAAARERRVPFLGLRSISDEAGDVLPAVLADCQEPGGAVPSARIAWRLFLRPTLVRPLLDLRRRVRAASDRLAGALEELLSHS